MKSKKLIVKPKKQKGEDGHKVFSIRVKDEIVTQLEEICSRTGHSRNELISMFLEYALENCEIEEPIEKNTSIDYLLELTDEAKPYPRQK